MKRAIITPAVLAGTALDELKAWLAVTTPGDDAALAALLRTALETCEGFTGAMPLAQLCEEIVPASGSWRTLGTRPVQAVTWVEGIPVAGARFTIPVADYAVDLDADGGARFRLVRSGEAERVAVRFTAGLAAGWSDLPESVRHGALRLAAHHYRQRESDTAQAMPPAAIAALWRPWRRVRVA
ncbi:MAG TPA: hypothetical protein VI168_10275 [Croceibacterium sp.]